MCMYDGYGDSPTVSSHRQHRARKAHKCVECGRDIVVGEMYHYDFQIYEGWPFTSHTCKHCRVAQSWLIRECGGYMIKGTWEDIAEHIREYPSLRFPLGRLVLGARRKWKAANDALVAVPLVPTVSVAEYVRG